MSNTGNLSITTLEVAGFIPALHGMRNPMDSWEYSDSFMCDLNNCYDCPHHHTTTCYGAEDGSGGGSIKGIVNIGDADMILARKLAKAGAEHRKYLRQIQVWADFNMPRYWWQEMDTYHWVTKNSCSTMHTLHKREFDFTDFYLGNSSTITLWDTMTSVLWALNDLREKYLRTNDFVFMMEMKRLLPESFLQMRTVNTNYESLANMYHQRKTHRQKEEWIDTFCSWCESLPYFVELCLDAR